MLTIVGIHSTFRTYSLKHGNSINMAYNMVMATSSVATHLRGNIAHRESANAKKHL